MYDQEKDKNRKLPAFTIAELVVVALLSVITVSIGFTALDLISRQFNDYGKDSDRLLVYSDLTRLLNRDFLLCNQIITRTGREVDLYFDSMTISYSLQPDHLLRSSNLPGSLLDTFYLKVSDFYPTFEGQTVSAGWIDYLQIKALIDGRPHDLLFSKTYAAEDFYRMQSK